MASNRGGLAGLDGGTCHRRAVPFCPASPARFRDRRYYTEHVQQQAQQAQQHTVRTACLLHSHTIYNIHPQTSILRGDLPPTTTPLAQPISATQFVLLPCSRNRM